MMKVFISNALSLAMLPSWFADPQHPEYEPGFRLNIRVTAVADPAAELRRLEEAGYRVESCVGHADTARVFSGILGRNVQPNRCNVTLDTCQEDVLLVGQYRGPRLPEGATQLPEGASISWFLVELIEA